MASEVKIVQNRRGKQELGSKECRLTQEKENSTLRWEIPRGLRAVKQKELESMGPKRQFQKGTASRKRR